jgi:subtilase family serine protease
VNRRIVQVLTIAAVFGLVACANSAVDRSLVPQSAPVAQVGNGDVPFVTANAVRRLCALPETPEQMECFALVRTDVMPTLQVSPNVQGDVETCPFSVGYCPIDLQHAYKLPSLTNGIDKTVAIVDAFGYHRAASDLAYFRKTMGLKACTTETKCLRIVNQEGNPSPLPPEPPPSDDWRGEQSLDLDMVSGICPNCKIVLVQTNNDYTTNLYDGVSMSEKHGFKYIGLSWGGKPENSGNPIFRHTGIVISAAAGDDGGGGSQGGPIQPCTYAYVVCVGGTRLVHADNQRGWSETVWNDFTLDECGSSGDSPCGATGSACSTKISKPAWQTDQGCHMRSAADTSATASLRDPVIVYNSEIEPSCPPSECFFLFGGTSASTQIINAVYALAGNASLQTGAEYFWKHHSGHVNNVTSGNNIDPNLGIHCASSVTYICTARVGFNGPTGWGTPNGIDAY